MKKRFNHGKSIILSAILCGISYHVQAQRATEVYIPVGKSPGLSGRYCAMGRVETVNTANGTMNIKQGAEMKTCRITAGTEIYLDNSKRKLPNKKGAFSDIKQGLMVEVKYKNNKPDGLIEWVKVQFQ